MFKQFLHRRIAKLERAFGYDATYLHEVVDTSTPAFAKFTAFQWMSSHRDCADRSGVERRLRTVHTACRQHGVARRHETRCDRVAAARRSGTGGH
jgi:hypothetical protein